MTSAAPALRPARPTSDEEVAFARYLDTAADGFFRVMLGRQVRGSSDEVLVQVAGTIRRMRMAIVSILGRPLVRFIDHVPDGDFYLQALAVDDDQRGHGVGSLLIDHVEAEARAHRCVSGLRMLRPTMTVPVASTRAEG